MIMTTTGRRRRLAALVVAGLVAAPVTLAAPAHADTDYPTSQWYYSDFKMDQNLAVANGSGVTIALIDGGIDPSVPELAGANLAVQPTTCDLDGAATAATATGFLADHGTSMAVMLAGNGTGTWSGQGGKGVAPGAGIRYYAHAFPTSAQGPALECLNAAGDDTSDAATAAAIDDAVGAGAKVVSMSFGGGDFAATADAIARGEQKGVVFVAATDDTADSTSADRVDEPGVFNGVVLVNGVTRDIKPVQYSSSSALVTVAAPGDELGLGGFPPGSDQWRSDGLTTGSSPATAWTAGVIADAMSKWPDATGNQIVQLLCRTTDGSLHGLDQRQADGFGFGVPSLTAMLANDPSSLPDQNPLLRDGAVPSTAQILGAGASASSSPTGAPSSSASPAPASAPPDAAQASDGSGSHAGLWIGIGVAVAVVVLALIAVVVVRSRRSRRPGPPPGPPAPSGPPPTYAGHGS